MATPKNQLTVDDLKAPLLAAVGAADLALERVNEIVATLRERAGEARSDAEARVGESRARLDRLQQDLPTQFGDLRERLTSDELRQAAESYADAAQTRYNKLVERGEAALERARTGTRNAVQQPKAQRKANKERTKQREAGKQGKSAKKAQPSKMAATKVPAKASVKKASVKKASVKKASVKKASVKKVSAKKVSAKKAGR